MASLERWIMERICGLLPGIARRGLNKIFLSLSRHRGGLQIPSLVVRACKFLSGTEHAEEGQFCARGRSNSQSGDCRKSVTLAAEVMLQCCARGMIPHK
jgi:hypothetical protein